MVQFIYLEAVYLQQNPLSQSFSSHALPALIGTYFSLTLQEIFKKTCILLPSGELMRTQQKPVDSPNLRRVAQKQVPARVAVRRGES